MGNTRSDKLREECGVFGFFDNDNNDCARITYYGLHALQHRGQESCGIAVNDNGVVVHHKDLGLVSEVFNDIILNHLKGQMAIGHVRYSTTGNNSRENAQPLVIKNISGTIALVHNGNLINASEIRESLESEGAIFQTTIDSEVIAYLITKERIISNSTEEAVMTIMKKIKGSYALVIMGPDKIIGVRDPKGIRPLSIGKLENSFILASETVAFDTIDGEFIRDVEPGEIVTIDKSGIHSIKTIKSPVSNLCIFEYIYFARPDSVLEGISVYETRKEAGRILAKEHPVDADLVIGVPDSGIASAIGYAEESKIPYGEGLIKNRYIGRTFIQPNQTQRKRDIKIKLNALENSVKGKRIIMVDDSIVRGSTINHIIQMLKEAGAKEVHMRISSPPFKWPCYFGTDIPSKNQLIACKHSVKTIGKKFNADSLAYLSLKGLMKTTKKVKCTLCNGCFSGNYPMEVPQKMDKFTFEKKNK